MTTNARKWQLKCNEIQNLIDGEIMLKEDLQSKLYMTEKKVAVFCFYAANSLLYFERYCTLQMKMMT